MPKSRLINEEPVYSIPIPIPKPTRSRTKLRVGPIYHEKSIDVIKEKANGPQKCMYCLNKFNDDEYIYKIKKCGHSFHTHCLEKYMNKGCPICSSFFGLKTRRRTETRRTETKLRKSRTKSRTK